MKLHPQNAIHAQSLGSSHCWWAHLSPPVQAKPPLKQHRSLCQGRVESSSTSVWRACGEPQPLAREGLWKEKKPASRVKNISIGSKHDLIFNSSLLKSVIDVVFPCWMQSSLKLWKARSSWVSMVRPPKKPIRHARKTMQEARSSLPYPQIECVWAMSNLHLAGLSPPGMRFLSGDTGPALKGLSTRPSSGQDLMDPLGPKLCQSSAARLTCRPGII